MNLKEMKNKVHCGDCLEVMKDIPDKSIDLVLTDPPYNASNGSLKETINEEWDKTFNPIPFLDEAFRLIKDGGSVLVFCSYHLLGVYLQYDAKVQQIIHWQHISSLPAIAKVYTPTIEYIVWYTTPNYTFNKKFAGKNVIRSLKPYQLKEKYGHPSPKPEQLAGKLLNVHSKEGDLILDPFAGSGTTGRACKDLGREFILIEKEPKYVEICKKRLQQEVMF